MNCSEDIAECATAPCLNGGTCTEPSPGTYSCDCPPGVRGTHCQIVADATFRGSDVFIAPPISTRRSRRRRDLVSATQRGSGQFWSGGRSKRQVGGATRQIDIRLDVHTTVPDSVVFFASGVSCFTVVS